MFTKRSSRFTKPAPGASIDWGHPLSRDLAFAVIPGQEQRNLATGDLGTLLGTGVWEGATALGDALESHSTTADGAHWPFPQILATATTRVSIFMFVDVDSTADYGHIFSIPYRESLWNPPWGAILYHRVIQTGSMSFSFAVNGTTRDSVNSDAGFPFFTTGLHSYAVVRLGSTVRFYFDGSPIGADQTLSGGNLTIDWGEKRPVTLLRHSSSDTGEGVNGRSPVAYMWGNALVDDDIALLHTEPFTLIVPPVSRRIYIPAAAGGGLVTRKTLLGVGA